MAIRIGSPMRPLRSKVACSSTAPTVRWGMRPPAGPAWIAYGEEGARRLKLAVKEGLIRGCFLELAFARMSHVSGADVGAANQR